MGASLPAPSLFHPLASAFLLSYLGAYFLLGRFNPLLGQYLLIEELFHMGMVSVPIGSLATGLNPSAAIHLLGDMFPREWVPDKDLLVLLHDLLVPNLVLLHELQVLQLVLLYEPPRFHLHHEPSWFQSSL
ncbi:hypothetical protein DSO57_1001410 [Entomophthora muscae]|uniref:Uncharacterized protein n=1 Tax=Entomophthora muscae TaxID=34485 RepID=A0ACC2TKP1_9FUNG|nr:hypothetical protein DSO57_1001410 [Entomophthora muscae]